MVREEDRKKGEPGETQFVGKVPNTPLIQPYLLSKEPFVQ